MADASAVVFFFSFVSPLQPSRRLGNPRRLRWGASQVPLANLVPLWTEGAGVDRLNSGSKGLNAIFSLPEPLSLALGILNDR